MARVLIIDSEGGELRVPLSAPVYVLGRGMDCDIRLTHPSLSRRHARLLVQESGCTVEDLGSSNGTFVNGERVSGETSLSSGDVVHFGELRALFSEEAEVEPRRSGRGRPQPAPPKRRPAGGIGLRQMLEGEVEIEDELRQAASSWWRGGIGARFGWRFKLVVLVGGVLMLAGILVGAVLSYQQRDDWMNLAYLTLRPFAADNRAGLAIRDVTLLSGDVVAGDPRVLNPVVLTAEGIAMWPRQIAGEPWEGWPQQPPPSDIRYYLLPPAPGAPPTRPRILLPVEAGDRHVGWVAAEWDREAAGDLTRPWGIVLAVAAFLVLLSYLVLEGASKWVTRPLRAMTAEVLGASGEERLHLEAPGDVPELGELIEAVRMTLSARAARQLDTGLDPADRIEDWAESLPVPIVLIDEHYRVVASNPEGRRLLGLPAAGEGDVHLARALQGSYFGSEVIRLLKTCPPGGAEQLDIELRLSGTEVPVTVMVSRPAARVGYAAALAVVEQTHGEGR
jgi:hypothetical protein